MCVAARSYLNIVLFLRKPNRLLQRCKCNLVHRLKLSEMTKKRQIKIFCSGNWGYFMSPKAHYVSEKGCFISTEILIEM